MANLSDGVFKSVIAGIFFGMPILLGIMILSIPLLIISCFTGIPMNILIQNLLIFVIAAFFVWLFSKYQIIENGIVGLIAGVAAYTYLQWHAVTCILTGVATIGLLVFVSHIKIGFWVKTILFSVVVTFMIFEVFYSDTGFSPLPDTIWEVVFVIIFFLENIYIRCSVAYNSRGDLLSGNRNSQTEIHYDVRENQNEFVTALPGGNVDQANSSTISEINNFVRKMNTEILEKQESEESNAYLMERVYLFSQKKSFWDGNLINNMEEKVYSELKNFVDKEYLILPHVSFREIFWWGDWQSDQKLADRVTKMHFDFGIYNQKLQPIFFLEVQGKEHKENPKVIERDKFKVEIMKRCGMKLITMDCSESMSDSEIRENVVACIRKGVPDRKAQVVYCPNCKNHGKNSLMIIKRNKSDGTFFYGCSTYEENRKENCPTLNLEDVPPLYWGIPLFKDKNK